MKKGVVVVTGGAGFIGSHLSSRLLELGYTVRILDNLSQGRREWVPSGAEFVEGDITDLAMCRRVCENATGVFHLAAMSKVAPSIEKFEYCTEQNIIGTQNVLMAARDARVGKIVYAGSSTYYGNMPAPQREDVLPQCLNPYALSKYVGEQFCELFTTLYGVPTIVVRYFNVYGRRQPKVGAYALVMGIFLDQHHRGEALTIHGTGEQRRDFIHVRDAAEATIAAFTSDTQGMVLNVGSGTNVSILELAQMISDRHVFHPRRTGDAEITLADLTRTRKVLRWEPQVPFATGLRELVDHPDV